MKGELYTYAFKFDVGDEVDFVNENNTDTWGETPGKIIYIKVGEGDQVEYQVDWSNGGVLGSHYQEDLMLLSEGSKPSPVKEFKSKASPFYGMIEVGHRPDKGQWVEVWEHQGEVWSAVYRKMGDKREVFIEQDIWHLYLGNVRDDISSRYFVVNLQQLDRKGS